MSPSSVKLLGEPDMTLVPREWGKKRRSAGSWCAYVITAILLFGLGICTGVVLNAVLLRHATIVQLTGGDDKLIVSTEQFIGVQEADDVTTPREELTTEDDELTTTDDDGSDEENSEATTSADDLTTTEPEEEHTTTEDSEETTTPVEEEEPITTESESEESEESTTTDEVEATTSDDEETSSQRPRSRDCKLPSSKHRTLEAQRYNITLHPNTTSAQFTATLHLSAKVLGKTDTLILHADHLKLQHSVFWANGRQMEASKINCQSKGAALWAFDLERTLRKGDGLEVQLEYSGKLEKSDGSVYYGSDSDSDDNDGSLFPYIDENDEATFQVNVIRKSKQVVRSNTNLKVTKEKGDGTYIDVFKESTKLSPDLISIVVLDDFAFVKKTSKKTHRPVEVRVYYDNDDSELDTSLALTSAARAVDFFEQFFNISYPLNKLDVVAVDGSSVSLGLSLVSPDELLVSNYSTSTHKQDVVLAMCHTVAKQWLFSIGTDDEPWLSDAIGAFLKYKCADKLYPQWNVMNRFVLDTVFSHEDEDLLPSAKSLSKETDDEFAQDKAAALLRMLESVVGERSLQKAFGSFLKLKDDEQTSEQLWESVQSHSQLTSSLTLNEVMNGFTEQAGMPLVRVSLKNDRVTVHSQERMELDEERSDEKDSDEEWVIPMNIRTDTQSDVKTHFALPNKKNGVVKLDEQANWMIANEDGLGYYTTLYSADLYDDLTELLKKSHQKLTVNERVSLLADTYHLSFTSHLNISTFLRMVQYARSEDSGVVWTIIQKNLRQIELMLQNSDFITLFKDFERSLVLGLYEDVAWKSPVTELQKQVMSFACHVRHRNCIRQANSHFTQWIKNKKKFSPETSSIILEEGIRQGGASTWEKVFAMYKAEEGVQEKERLLLALAASQDISIVQKLLRLCVDGSVRAQSVAPLIRELATNTATQTHTWRFVRQNWQQLSSFFDSRSLLDILSIFAQQLNSHNDVQEFNAFLDHSKINTQAKEELHERIAVKSQWLHNNEQHALEFLRDWDDERRETYNHKRRI